MKYLSILVLFSLLSCSSEKSKNEITLKENELISQLLPVLIGNNNIPPGPSPEFNPEIETREQYKEKLELSLQKHQ